MHGARNAVVAAQDAGDTVDFCWSDKERRGSVRCSESIGQADGGVSCQFGIKTISLLAACRLIGEYEQVVCIVRWSGAPDLQRFPGEFFVFDVELSGDQDLIEHGNDLWFAIAVGATQDPD